MSADARRHRFRPQVVALLGVLVVVVLAGVSLAQCDSDQAAAPESSESASTDPGPGISDGSSESTETAPATSEQTTSVQATSPSTDDASEPTAPPETIDPVAEPSAQDATISVTNFLERVPIVINPPPIDDTSASGTETLPDLSAIATGGMVDELLATAAEFEAMGWTQSGSPVIVDVRVVQAPTTQQPFDAVVEVCLDNSNVQILDESGRNVRPADTPPRTLNIFVLRLVDGSWLIAERNFPDDPDC